MKHANSSPSLTKNGESGKTDTQSISSEGSAGSETPPKSAIYEVISDRVSGKMHKVPSPRLLKKLTNRKCITPTEDAPFRRETKSFSSFVFRRSNSDRFKKNKMTAMDPAVSSTLTKQALHRTPSLDKLDDRMERSVRLSGPVDGDDSSSDEEEAVLSPTEQGRGCITYCTCTCTCAVHYMYIHLYWELHIYIYVTCNIHVYRVYVSVCPRVE